MRPPGARPLALVASALLLAIVVLGVGLRAAEIRETVAIGAEDPYTHVVYTRESLENGAFGRSFYVGSEMYPPGMHALVGVLASLSGVDLLTLARWLPLAFGALAILGTYALAARLGGRPAGLTAAFLVAVMPEHIFRTQLLFPTALDLALLPAWLLLFHEATRPAPGAGEWFPQDRMPAAALFLALSVPFAWMHPWAIPLFGLGCLGYATLRTLRSTPGPAPAMRAMVLPATLVSASTAFAMAFRWDVSDTGFSVFLAKLGPLAAFAKLDLPVIVLFAVLLAALLAASLLGTLAVAALVAIRLPRRARLGLSMMLALGLVVAAWTWPSVGGMPRVSLVHMLGAVTIALGLAGIVVAFLRPSPLADMGLAIGIVLAPLVATDVFGGRYWPGRTVVYLAFAVALLGGAAMGALAAASTSRARTPRLRRAAVPLAAVATVLLLAGASAAAPAKTYDWYRLYDEDDYAALQRVVGILDENDEARVFVQTWQPALLFKALGDLEDPWYSPAFFRDAQKREEQIRQTHGPAYALVDDHTRKEAAKGRADLSFLDDERLVLQSADGEILLYRLK